MYNVMTLYIVGPSGAESPPDSCTFGAHDAAAPPWRECWKTITCTGTRNRFKWSLCEVSIVTVTQVCTDAGFIIIRPSFQPHYAATDPAVEWVKTLILEGRTKKEGTVQPGSPLLHV